MDWKWIVIAVLVWFAVNSWRDAKITNSMIAAHRKEDLRKNRHIARLQNALANFDREVLWAVNERCEKEWREAHRREDGVVDMTYLGIPDLPPINDD